MIEKKTVRFLGKEFIVYSDGRLYSPAYTDMRGHSRNGKFRKPGTTPKGYLFYTIKYNNKCKLITVHRLVATTFIPTNNQQLHIDHINGDKHDNCVGNLRWVTPSQNQRGFRKISGRSKYRGVSCKKGRWCSSIRINGENVHGGSFDTQKEAARSYDSMSIKYGFRRESLNFPEVKNE